MGMVGGSALLGRTPAFVGPARRRVVLASALVLLNLADVLVTRALLDRGGVEANPLMRGLMEGLAAPLSLKLVVSVLVGLLLLSCPARSRVAESAVGAVVAGYSLVVAWNLLLVFRVGW